MKKLSAIFIAFISICAYGQTGGVGINVNGYPPDPSAMLDVSSTNRGLLMPRLTQVQRDSVHTPALGLEIFNTTDNCIEVYGFGYWQSVTCLCSGPPSAPSLITGNSNPCANATNIIYSTSAVAGANSYAWTVPAGAAIIAGQGTNSITVNFGVNPGNVAVSAVNSCGSSHADTLAVTINTIPLTPGSISGADTVCANSVDNIYTISSVAGATTYNWSLPSGTVTGGQGTDSIVVSFGATSGNMSVTAGNVCGNSQASILQMIVLNNQGSQQFYFTGNQQIFVVPACVTTITLAAYGAQGGTGSDGPSGYGGFVNGNLSVTPGDTLYIYVGSQANGTTGGYNGGGNGVGGGRGGGGASDVRFGGTALANRVIVGGGGGGTTSAGWSDSGGSGGGITGGAGTSSNGGGHCGQGGSQNAGGAGATAYSDGNAGTLGQGGNASPDNNNDAGGGGGYYGGGGGAAGGGGGGSGYIGGVNGGFMQNGSQAGNGQVIINW